MSIRLVLATIIISEPKKAIREIMIFGKTRKSSLERMSRILASELICLSSEAI